MNKVKPGIHFQLCESKLVPKLRMAIGETVGIIYGQKYQEFFNVVTKVSRNVMSNGLGVGGVWCPALELNGGGFDVIPKLSDSNVIFISRKLAKDVQHKSTDCKN